MTITMCCSVYRITSAEGPEVGYLSSMVIACLIETFIAPWINQNFTLEIFELQNRIYELEWLSYPPKTRRLLLFLMQRIQKPFYFTMGSWRPLDVAVFLATIKFSYSFYTLITQSASKLARKPTYGETN
uniref:Odorant receptor 51 n=1 Tax=Eucryptorrhynchus scrobiculatus TaxID=1552824 RepID=A0A8F2FBL4_EUCSC|nr:odorant receptor 51 [Eucryptorrhynchus scrobiculatus]